MTTPRTHCLIAAFIVLVAVFHAAKASADSAWIRSIAFAGGVSHRSLPDMRDILPGDVPEPNGAMPSFGLMGYLERPSGYGFGLDLMYAAGSARGDDADVEWWDSTTLVVFGYAWRFGRFDIGPRFGGGTATMQYVYRAKDDSSARDVLGASNGSGSIDGVAFVVDGKLYARWHFTGPRDEKSGFLGLVAGYSGSPFETDWRFFSRNVSGGPEHRYQSPYGLLTIGFEF